jgi:hypothetical protein
MAKIKDVHSIVVPAGSANLSAHTYTEIYGGSAGCSVTVNGVSVNIGASSSINLTVRSITGGTGCFLLGENINVGVGTTSIG